MWHAWERKVYTVLVGKPKEIVHLEDRDMDGIKMEVRDIGRGGVDRVGSG
jgi:hypothetical protein